VEEKIPENGSRLMQRKSGRQCFFPSLREKDGEGKVGGLFIGKNSQMHGRRERQSLTPKEKGRKKK